MGNLAAVQPRHRQRAGASWYIVSAMLALLRRKCHQISAKLHVSERKVGMVAARPPRGTAPLGEVEPISVCIMQSFIAISHYTLYWLKEDQKKGSYDAAALLEWH